MKHPKQTNKTKTNEFLNKAQKKYQKHLENDKFKTSGKTYLEIMGGERDEVTFSNLLHFFLDPNEQHGFGKYFLELFLCLLL